MRLLLLAVISTLLTFPALAQADVRLTEREAQRQAVSYLERTHLEARVYHCYHLGANHRVRLCDFESLRSRTTRCDGGVKVRKTRGSYRFRPMQVECYRS